MSRQCLISTPLSKGKRIPMETTESTHARSRRQIWSNTSPTPSDIRLIHPIDQVIGLEIVLPAPGPPDALLHGEDDDDGGDDPDHASRRQQAHVDPRGLQLVVTTIRDGFR